MIIAVLVFVLVKSEKVDKSQIAKVGFFSSLGDVLKIKVSCSWVWQALA